MRFNMRWLSSPRFRDLPNLKSTVEAVDPDVVFDVLRNLENYAREKDFFKNAQQLTLLIGNLHPITGIRIP